MNPVVIRGPPPKEISIPSLLDELEVALLALEDEELEDSLEIDDADETDSVELEIELYDVPLVAELLEDPDALLKDPLDCDPLDELLLELDELDELDEEVVDIVPAPYVFGRGHFLAKSLNAKPH